MVYVIAFKMENGLPVASRMLRYPATWCRLDAKANARFVLGREWELSVKGGVR